MIKNLNVIAIKVLDQDEAFDFYVNKLGLEPSTMPAAYKSGEYFFGARMPITASDRSRRAPDSSPLLPRLPTPWATSRTWTCVPKA